MYEISDQLYEYLLSFAKPIQLDIMLEAIDTMQAFNGRSITHCIMIAINAEEIGNEGRQWKLPTKASVIRQFK